jgi:hypothetical protein
MNTTPLQDAYRTLLKAAATVAKAGDEVHAPPAGEWNADQILAHVALVNAVTITAVCRVASGANATYDNRMALDPWTIDRVISLAGGNAGLQVRIAAQGEALSALAATLGETELDTLLSTLLLSNAEVLVDQPVPLRDLITGLAEVEIPGHTKQILALLAERAEADASR